MKKIYFVILLMAVVGNNLVAADYYWKGGSGNYNDINNWELNAVSSALTPLNAPLSTDNVIFPATAFTTPGDTIWVDGPSSCLNMTWETSIAAANAPVFIDVPTTPVGSTTLDIYGSFTLSPNMLFKYRGMLRFRSVSGTAETITTAGNPLLMKGIEFDGASNTEWQLTDDLYLDDVAQSTANWGWYWNSVSRQGQIALRRGTFNSMGFDMRMDYFYSNFGNSDRGIKFSNSAITLCGYSAGYARPWFIDFDYTTANYSSFDLTGTHLIFQQSGGTNQSLELGNGMQYDSLTAFNSIYMLGGTRPDTFNYMNMMDGGTHYLNLEVDDLYWTAGKTYIFMNSSGKGELTIGNLNLAAICDKFTNIQALGTLRGLIRKKTPGTLSFENSIIERMDCDTVGGRFYVANNSIDGGGNHVGWTINTAAGTDFYFRDNSGDQNWHDVNNWAIWDGVAFQPNSTGCVPGPIDNVFFDGASFPNANKYVKVDSTAYCHDMRWKSTVVAGCAFVLNSDIRIYGTMELHSNMLDMTGTNSLYFYGNDPDSIITNGVVVSRIYLWRYAEYYLIGNTACNGDFTSFLYSTIHAKHIDLTCRNLMLSTRNLDSVQVYITYQSFQDIGGTDNYTGNTTFHFTGTLSIVRANRYYPYNNHVRLPNVVAYNSKMLFEGITNTIKGDLLLHQNADFRANSGTSVTGSMPLYTGNVRLTAGKAYQIRSLSIADSLIAVGNCNEYITIEPYSVNTGTLHVSGEALMDYCFVINMNNTGPTITSSTSIDGSGNSNFVFNTGSGLTYYWRANAADPADYEGNWSDPNHWTINAADLQGTAGGCIPALTDSVIFDHLSFSATSNGCTIDQNAFCKTIICKDDISLAGNAALYVGESFHLANNMTAYTYNGYINFIGSGSNNILNPNNTSMGNHLLSFKNAAGTWNLAADLHLTSLTNNGSTGFILASGTFNSNDFDITLDGLSFSAYSGNLNLGASTINMMSNAAYSNYYGDLWTLSNATNLTFDAGTSIINFMDNTSSLSYDKLINTGDGQSYNRVNFYEIDEQTVLSNNSNFRYAFFEGSARITGNNYFDSLRLNGGHYYYLNDNTTQTLAPEHGRINVNGSPGNYAYIECAVSGGTSYFHKEYGTSFCLDYVKVKDNEATKGATDPVDPARHPFLYFETGSNSDNINGTATGIWAFNLPPVLTVSAAHADTMDICSGGDSLAVPLTLTGTYPYSIIYSWTDMWGGSGADTVIVNDDDADVNTPFTYNLMLYPQTSTDYSLDIAGLRCGDRNFNAPLSDLHVRLKQETLVSVNSESSCVLNNNTVWSHFMDDVEAKPMLSILDSIDNADVDSLGLVDVQTDFDATVQYWAGEPYLQRHWKIDPANTLAGGKVRLYFTQAELDNLTAHTFVASLGRSLDPATELVLRKFEDSITVGTAVEIPFTVIPLTGKAADPFSSVTDVIAIEFEVAAFSGFMLQPSVSAFLPLTMLSFDAALNDNNKVELHWETSAESDLSHYEIQRSSDAIHFEVIEEEAAQNRPENQYLTIDEHPLSGVAYYRLKGIDNNGDFNYSAIRSVEREGIAVLNVFPNPVQDLLHIQYVSTTENNLQSEITDMYGRLLSVEKHTARPGQNHLKLSVSRLMPGSYILKLKVDGADCYYQKIIVYL